MESAAHEFAETEAMIARAEELFGPYEWDRYDMLVLPPSFPYGGMENPRMTFLTPTLLAGDRSLVDVVAHELAHSWTGNLVTNADMEHFWLNEGFTVWAERRLLEALHGEEATILSWAIGEKALEESLERFGKNSPLTRLRTELAGMDPDDAFSSVPYEKGARFVTLLERTAGRVAIRPVHAGVHGALPLHIDHHRGVPGLPRGASSRVPPRRWTPGRGSTSPGCRRTPPSSAPPRLDGLVALAQAFARGERPGVSAIAGWTPAETLVYLQNLPREIEGPGCAWLDAAMGLGARGNYEILVEWLTVAAGSDYEPAFARLREVLLTVGRMKYLRPLYGAMGRHERTRALARSVFAEAAPRYHALSRRVAASVIEKYADAPAS